MKERTLKVGVGIGEIRFGMYRQDVWAILGEPDRVWEGEHREQFDYYDEQLSIWFDRDDHLRLHWIECPNDVYFGGHALIGMTEAQIMDVFSELSAVVERDDHSSFVSITFQPQWVEVQLTLNRVQSVNFGYLFDDDENPSWP